ncbi:MAG: type II/IV secretion system protein [Gammaproteobacteria bacterium]|nr:type II/IV secretion system protein [Gammaproteobacteria bacterium]
MFEAASITRDSNRLDAIALLNQLEQQGFLSQDKAALMRNVIRPEDCRAKGAIELLASKQLPNAKKPVQKLNLDFLCKWLAENVGLEFFTIDPLKIDVDAVTKVMSYAYAQRFGVLPVKVTLDTVIIATVEPFDIEWGREISRIANKTISLVIANPDDIRRYQVELYNLSKSVQHAKNLHESAISPIQNLEQLVEMGRKDKLDANSQHVVSIVDWLLQYAFDQRASDIHLEPRRLVGNVRFRIDGVMHKVYEMPPVVMTAVTSRIKILGRMDVAEKRRPQDGRLKTKDQGGGEVELRLSTMPTAFGEKLVMRIFDPEVVSKGFEDLGFSNQDSEKWQSMISQPNGIILVTGPTGSGKTTTLYSSLKMLATPEVNVCSVEDPIENIEPKFNQMQVQHNIDLDFASGVRTLLRQDPDIIMIGEIRDLETAQMAIQASLTGHLVLSTLHTNDATSAITRLQEIGVPSYLINATLLGVMAQRLVRTLCPKCKKPAQLDENAWKGMLSPWKTAMPKTVYEPVGCLDCRQTGFRGRIGLYEIFIMSDALKTMNKPNMDFTEFRKLAVKEGMLPLRLSGAQKIAAGLTTIAEVLKVTPPASGFGN